MSWGLFLVLGQDDPKPGKDGTPTDQRTDSSCFPFQTLPSRCQPLGAPGLWAVCGVLGVGGWQSLAAPSGQSCSLG